MVSKTLRRFACLQCQEQMAVEECNYGYCSAECQRAHDVSKRLQRDTLIDRLEQTGRMIGAAIALKLEKDAAAAFMAVKRPPE